MRFPIARIPPVFENKPFGTWTPSCIVGGVETVAANPTTGACGGAAGTWSESCSDTTKTTKAQCEAVSPACCKLDGAATCTGFPGCAAVTGTALQTSTACLALDVGAGNKCTYNPALPRTCRDANKRTAGGGVTFYQSAVGTTQLEWRSQQNVAGPAGGTRTLTCSDYALNPHYCDVYGFYWDNSAGSVTASEACCVGGGGQRATSHTISVTARDPEDDARVNEKVNGAISQQNVDGSAGMNRCIVDGLDVVASSATEAACLARTPPGVWDYGQAIVEATQHSRGIYEPPSDDWCVAQRVDTATFSLYVFDTQPPTLSCEDIETITVCTDGGAASTVPHATVHAQPGRVDATCTGFPGCAAVTGTALQTSTACLALDVGAGNKCTYNPAVTARCAAASKAGQPCLLHPASVADNVDSAVSWLSYPAVVTPLVCGSHTGDWMYGAPKMQTTSKWSRPAGTCLTCEKMVCDKPAFLSKADCELPANAGVWFCPDPAPAGINPSALSTRDTDSTGAVRCTAVGEVFYESKTTFGTYCGQDYFEEVGPAGAFVVAAGSFVGPTGHFGPRATSTRCTNWPAAGTPHALTDPKYAIGEYALEFTATDTYKNSNTCQSKLVVQDCAKPVLATSDISTTTAPGVCYCTLESDHLISKITAVDNSGIRPYVQVQTLDGLPIDSDFKFTIGTTTLKAIATDMSGAVDAGQRLQAEQEFTVTCSDDEPPVMQGCVDITAGCSLNSRAATIKTRDNPEGDIHSFAIHPATGAFLTLALALGTVVFPAAIATDNSGGLAKDPVTGYIARYLLAGTSTPVTFGATCTGAGTAVCGAVVMPAADPATSSNKVTAAEAQAACEAQGCAFTAGAYTEFKWFERTTVQLEVTDTAAVPNTAMCMFDVEIDCAVDSW